MKRDLDLGIINAANGNISVQVSPIGPMEILSKSEQARLLDRSNDGLHQLFRRCCLAVLNSGGVEDHTYALLERYPDFDVTIVQRERGIKIDLQNAPAQAFVDGVLIQGIQANLFSVLRDILYMSTDPEQTSRFNMETSAGITDAVFYLLRQAGVLRQGDPNMVVCWGGHSIQEAEYIYTKKVGYELGLRNFDITTGCGPGAMKGPMKGATIAHSKQRGNAGGRYIGLTEPGIIAAESPNPIVNELVILPSIEQRLEAFIRTAHAVVVFPGGVGTAEEILYILGILLHPKNADQPLPLVFTGPASAAAYFERIDHFIRSTLGDEATKCYRIIIDDPVEVARHVQAGIQKVREHRKTTSDAYYFNWGLHIEAELQLPFEPTHASMSALRINRSQPAHTLAAQLRRAFSGVVAGNVKADGVKLIAEKGPFSIHGEPQIMEQLDALLTAFTEQHRMKLPGTAYKPCYTIVRDRRRPQVG